MKLQKPCYSAIEGVFHGYKPQFSTLPRRLAYLAYTLHLFTCNDLPEIVVMPLFFAAATMAAAPLFGILTEKSPSEFLFKVPTMICWSWINLLLFNIHNQRHPNSVLTDSTSKPWRPIPSKRISAEQSRILLFILYPLMALYCLTFGGLKPYLAQILWCVWYNEWKGAKDPICRNFLNATGITTLMAGPLEIAIGDNHVLTEFPTTMKWLIIIGATIFTTAQIQDFRDQKEDWQEERRTIPIILGDATARWVTAVFVLVWSFLVPRFWAVRLAAYVPTLVLGTIMATSLICRRNVRGDKSTWRLWAPWMISFYLLPIMRRYG